MSEVVVVVVVKPKPGNERVVLGALSELAAHSHGEPGNIRYAIHQPADDPTTIVVVERWRSQADLDEHFTKPYMAAISDALPLLEEPPAIHFLAPIPVGDAVKGVL